MNQFNVTAVRNLAMAAHLQLRLSGLSMVPFAAGVFASGAPPGAKLG